MWINLVCFNISWFGLVLIGDSFIPVTLSWIAFHLYTVKQKREELITVISVSAIGILVDSLLLYFDVFKFGTSAHIPFWLMVLWVSFAATISHSLAFLKNSMILQLAAGGLFAPLSYLAGYNFGAVEFVHPAFITYFLLSLIWGPLMVLFFFIRSKLGVEDVCNA